LIIHSSKPSVMKERNDNRNKKKNENLNVKSLASYIKNYARNCRYSFNRILSA